MSLTRSCFQFRFIESALDYIDRTMPDENGNIYGVDKQVAKFMFSQEADEYIMLCGSEDAFVQRQEKWM